MLPVTLDCVVFLFCFSPSYVPFLPVSLDCVLFLFCFSPSCLPYDASFSGLCCVFALFFSVLSTLCSQFLWIVLCFYFVFLRLVYPMLPVSLDCALFCFVSLRLVYPMMPVSLDCVVFLFCFSPSCLPYVGRYSGLCFVFVLFFSVLCTKHYTFQRNWHHRIDKTERNKAKTQHNPERLVDRVHKTEKIKTKTKHNPE
jgi:hypothetical protein